jgi:C1A family cysteine protease
MAWKIARYGWIPDLPDRRDLLYAPPPELVAKLPARVDMRSQCPMVYDQGELGSCTAQAIAGALEFDQVKEGLPEFVPSRLFIYYNERALEGTVNFDSGGMLRDGIKTVASDGACPEPEWPYELDRLTQRPTEVCYRDGRKHRALQYERLPHDLTQLRACLASGYPFVYGMTVYQSFESTVVSQTGHVPMPASDERAIGGHAVMAVGYEDESQRFISRNSWGAGWGLAGYFTIPYEYLLARGLTADFWTIRLVA